MSIKILAKKLTKKFYLQQERTFKDLVPALLRGNSWAERHTVLNSINFDITQGECVGIVGKNGAGKSTLLKLIAGVTYPTSGKLEVSGKVAPLIELGAGFHHELTGYENIFLNAAILGMHQREVQERVDSIITFSGLADFIHIPVKRYSSGMYMRLGFSVAIHTQAPILLIDEILAVGDKDFQKKCLAFLKEIKQQGKHIIIFVSHNEATVRSFCDRAILLEKGKITIDDTPAKVFAHYNDSGGLDLER